MAYCCLQFERYIGCTFPDPTAKNRTAHSTRSRSMTLQPLSISTLTTSIWPPFIAKISGVHPLAVATVTSAPCSRSSFTTSTCPLSPDKLSGVHLSALASPCSLWSSTNPLVILDSQTISNQLLCYLLIIIINNTNVKQLFLILSARRYHPRH